MQEQQQLTTASPDPAPSEAAWKREQILARKRAYNKRYRARNKAMGLTSAGTKWKVKSKTGFPSNSKEAKREYYIRHRDRMAARGLNAHGQPFKMGPRALKNVQRAQKLRRAREKSQTLLNGAIAAPVEPKDNLAESARAIIMAAQVLRSVSIGMKL